MPILSIGVLILFSGTKVKASDIATLLATEISDRS